MDRIGEKGAAHSFVGEGEKGNEAPSLAVTNWVIDLVNVDTLVYVEIPVFRGKPSHSVGRSA